MRIKANILFHQEIFWKYYLIDNLGAQKLIKRILAPKKDEKKEEIKKETKPEIEEEMEKEEITGKEKVIS